MRAVRQGYRKKTRGRVKVEKTAVVAMTTLEFR
jgi:hypothetical protein